MLTVSTHIRYALRGLVFIALNQEQGPVSISEIAERENISRKYLENIFNLLKKGGILRSVRGPEGGYMLQRTPEELALLDIVRAVDGSITIADCLEDPELCGKGTRCATRNVWRELQDTIESFFSSRTLQDVLTGSYSETLTHRSGE